MATFKKATITREDFETAEYMSNDDCPIARAIKRIGGQNVSVGGSSYGYSINGKRFRTDITPKLVSVLGVWYGLGVYPNSFTFQVPVAQRRHHVKRKRKETSSRTS